MTLAGIVACLTVGLLIGLLNGACNALLRMPSFIVTLAVMMFGGGWRFGMPLRSRTHKNWRPAQVILAIGYGTVFKIPIALILSGVGVLIAAGTRFPGRLPGGGCAQSAITCKPPAYQEFRSRGSRWPCLPLPASVPRWRRLSAPAVSRPDCRR